MMSVKRAEWKQRALLVLVAVAGIIVGLILQRLFLGSPGAGAGVGAAGQTGGSETVEDEIIWTCSMHPNVRLPNPGQCPQCGMDLIPLKAGMDLGAEREIQVSPYAAQLMELQTVAVARRFVEADVRMVGEVDYDETRVSYISAWVPGRLDRLFVNYTGIPVKKGEHMVEMYSPELLTAQEELIQALKTVETLANSESDIVRDTATATVTAAREKLRLMGLTSAQIEEIEETRESRDNITIYAPAQGIVIHKNAQEGMYVQTGTRIYTIADLSQVWVKLDAYESDLQWVRFGGRVEFTTESYPGRVFSGMVSFIDPMIDPRTRTVDVRLTVPNEGLSLKPGMFVRAIARVNVAEGGMVLNQDFAGNWICPMHPDIVKGDPGYCDICGMPLVSAESLGYVSGENYNAPLVIPATAALKTGKRAVVYVEVPGREKPTYEGREVRLGMRLGDYYLVEEGLEEGERVVARGAFKLDAEMQIQAKPSMMSAPEATEGKADGPSAGMEMGAASPERYEDVPEEFVSQLNALVQSYFRIHDALASDDPEETLKAVERARADLEQVDMSLLQGEAHMVWMDHMKGLGAALTAMAGHEDLQGQREAFSLLSGQLTQTVQAFPVAAGTIYRARCPMAFDNKGASWLQPGEQIENPYFGATMFRCGSIEQEIDTDASGGDDE